MLMAMTLAVCAAIATRSLDDPTAGSQTPTSQAKQGALPEISARIIRVRDVRERNAADTPRETLARTSDQFPRIPRLIFDVLLDVNPKARIAWVTLQSAQAKDSTGKDLIEAMLKDDQGRIDSSTRRLQESVLPLDHAPALRWVVDSPERSATSVSGTLLVEVGVAEKTEKIELKLERTWTSIKLPSIASTNVEYRVVASPAGGTERIEFRPPEAATAIYRVDPRATPKGERAVVSIRDRECVGYSLDRKLLPDEPLSVTVFSNVWRATVALKLVDEALP